MIRCRVKIVSRCLGQGEMRRRRALKLLPVRFQGAANGSVAYTVWRNVESLLFGIGFVLLSIGPAPLDSVGPGITRMGVCCARINMIDNGRVRFAGRISL